jgi:hypothetical protein
VIAQKANDVATLFPLFHQTNWVTFDFAVANTLAVRKTHGSSIAIRRASSLRVLRKPIINLCRLD